MRKKSGFTMVEVALARDPKSRSRSSFKHMVYGLRYYYRLMGMNKNAIALPSLKRETKLPVILNHQELKELFAVPTLLKQRVVLTLIYSAGLRGQEVINLKIPDVDFERKVIHIRQSKYKKDRIVPLAGSMAVGLKKYLSAENPHVWLFNGKEPDGRYGQFIRRRPVCKNDSYSFANKSAGQNNAVPYLEVAYKSQWVVHCEPSMAGVEHVVKYLGQYTHRVVITNQRILNIENGKVTFIAKDYRDRAIKKPVTLDGVEFLRRFTMHILPKRFVKIRRYGIYNHTVKRNMALHFTSEKKSSNPKEKSLPPETKQQRFERLTGVNLCLCQACKTGRMITVRELPRIRSPGWPFLSFQNTNS